MSTPSYLVHTIEKCPCVQIGYVVETIDEYAGRTG